MDVSNNDKEGTLRSRSQRCTSSFLCHSVRHVVTARMTSWHRVRVCFRARHKHSSLHQATACHVRSEAGADKRSHQNDERCEQRCRSGVVRVCVCVCVPCWPLVALWLTDGLSAASRTRRACVQTRLLGHGSCNQSMWTVLLLVVVVVAVVKTEVKKSICMYVQDPSTWKAQKNTLR